MLDDPPDKLQNFQRRGSGTGAKAPEPHTACGSAEWGLFLRRNVLDGPLCSSLSVCRSTKIWMGVRVTRTRNSSANLGDHDPHSITAGRFLGWFVESTRIQRLASVVWANNFVCFVPCPQESEENSITLLRMLDLWRLLIFRAQLNLLSAKGEECFDIKHTESERFQDQGAQSLVWIERKVSEFKQVSKDSQCSTIGTIAT